MADRDQKHKRKNADRGLGDGAKGAEHERETSGQAYNKRKKQMIEERPTVDPTRPGNRTAHAGTSHFSKAKGKRTSTRFYAVKAGRRPGVYTSWAECEEQVKGFSCATCKRFDTREEAEEFVQQGQPVSKPTDTHTFSRSGLVNQRSEGVHIKREYVDLTDAAPHPTKDHRSLPMEADHQKQSRVQHAEPSHNELHIPRNDGLIQHAPTTYAGPYSRSQSQDSSPDAISLDSASDDRLLNDPGVAVPVPDIIPIDDGPTLCKEQSDLVDRIVAGYNVFYTGSAECGKSTVLKAFVRRLKVVGKRVQIVAPTGRAALDVNGSTTWTYAGWTPDHMKLSIEKLEQKAWQKLVHKRLNDTDVLVIDEISMMENHLFERLNRVLKSARRSREAFGGVQLVVTGDFCQLPPVKPFQHCFECGLTLKSYTKYHTCSKHGQYLDEDKWAFRSVAWKECQFQHVNLTSIHRQSDAVFIAILEKCRLGKPLDPADKELLLDHPSETTNAVQLFPTRAEVKRVNDFEFAKLENQTLSFTGVDSFHWNKEHLDLKSKQWPSVDGGLNALKDHRFEYNIELKKGMLVILLVNLSLDLGLVNGSQGRIINFVEHKAEMLPEQMGEHDVYKRGEIGKFIEQATEKLWPVVRFTNGVVRTIKANCTVNELGDSSPYSLLSRTQIPLIAAWAMSIHKSQGMTLDRVIVDLQRAFEEGQVYVALSRARSLEGLKVESLGACNFGGDEQVKEFLFEKFGVE